MLGTRVVAAIGLLALAACGGPVKTHGPDGNEAYIIDCKADPFACARQAGDLCGSRGYHPLDPTGQAIPPQAAPGNFREMMITCGNAPQTIYSGESQPPPQNGGEAASTLLNQSPEAARPPPQSSAATTQSGGGTAPNETAPQAQQLK